MEKHEMPSPEEHSASQRWLAYELHDGLLQWLISARMGLESVVRDLEPNQSALNSRLSNTLALVENALEEGRELIGFLDDQGVSSEHSFAHNLSTFVERIEAEARRRGQQVVYQQAAPAWKTLPSRTAWNLLRIAQQAVRNAMRHAGGCTIRIECGWKDPETLSLSISDNGAGFQPKSVSDKPMHFGLASMEHRAKLIGAEFQLHSAVGSGTSIRLSLPTGG